MSGLAVAGLAEERWEQGSEFHACFDRSGGAAHPWPDSAPRFGGGRDALRTLLAEGRDRRGLRRLWVPSYFCQEVVESLLQVGLPILPYEAGPEEPGPDLTRVPARPGDAVLRVNLFGLQALGSLRGLRREGVEYVDDHSHDPWSSGAWRSDADWCVVSLRKTVPVPDGGVLWSPSGHRLPAEPALTPERRQASLQKFLAMVLKASYLRGEPVEKELFRRFAVEGERGLGEGAPSAMTPWSRELMGRMPLEGWRKVRRRNHDLLVRALGGGRGLQVLPPPPEEAGCPFVAVLLFERPEGREAVKADLAAARIYAGAHWPMDPPAIPGIPESHLRLSRRILTLHCDARYGPEDLRRVAAAVLASVEKRTLADA